MRSCFFTFRAKKKTRTSYYSEGPEVSATSLFFFFDRDFDRSRLPLEVFSHILGWEGGGDFPPNTTRNYSRNYGIFFFCSKSKKKRKKKHDLTGYP